MEMKPLTRVLLGLVCLLVAIWLVAPTLVVVPMSFNANKSLAFPPQGFSWQWYQNFFTSPEWSASFLNSLKVACVVAVLATVLGTLAAFGLDRMKARPANLLRMLILTPMVVPGVVLAIGIYAVYLDTRLVGTLLGFVLAHTVLALPFVLIAVSASLEVFDRRLETAAASLGAGALTTFRTVTLPLILPGILSGLLFAFATSFDEIVVSLFITNPYLKTLPVQIFASITRDADPTVAAVGTILLFATTILIGGGMLLLGRERKGRPMNPRQESRGAAIDLEAITKAYGGFMALDGVSLRIEPGEFMTLLGPSGSGKTTTLNVVAGFTDVTSGKLLIGGKSVVGVPAHKRNIGVVFQHYALFPHMTVGGNVAYPLTLRGVDRTTRDARVATALDMVKMGDFAHRYPSELSGGQQQRVALARAIVFDPPLLLMDEPLGALDKKLREWLQLEIKRIHRELGTTFVYVTHDQEEALVLSDRIAVFNRGRIEQVGTGRQLYDEPATLFVGRFVGDSTVLRGEARSDGNSTALRIAGVTVTAPTRVSGEASPVMLLRPEKLAISRAGQNMSSGANRLPGTIAEAIYLGSGSKYEVKLGDGSTAVVRSSLTGENFNLGDQVELCFDGTDAKLLADDSAADQTLT